MDDLSCLSQQHFHFMSVFNRFCDFSHLQMSLRVIDFVEIMIHTVLITLSFEDFVEIAYFLCFLI